MLSDDQIENIERIYFRRDYLPLMVKHLEAEHLGRLERGSEDNICNLHMGLRRLNIFSPRNTFRFVRLTSLRPQLQQRDRHYFYTTLVRTAMPENTRFDILERNVLREDNSQRWHDLI